MAAPLGPGEDFRVTRVAPYRDGWWAEVPYETDGDGDVIDKTRDHVTECQVCGAMVSVGSIDKHNEWHTTQGGTTNV